MRVVMMFLVFFGILGASSSTEFQDGFGYAKDYNEAIQKAKESKKPVMMILDGKTCPWCRKLENQVLKKENINAFIHSNFVPVIIDREEGIYPKEFNPKGIPTTYIIDPETQKSFEEAEGYKPKDEFMDFLQKAAKRFEKK